MWIPIRKNHIMIQNKTVQCRSNLKCLRMTRLKPGCQPFGLGLLGHPPWNGQRWGVGKDLRIKKHKKLGEKRMVAIEIYWRSTKPPSIWNMWGWFRPWQIFNCWKCLHAHTMIIIPFVFFLRWGAWAPGISSLPWLSCRCDHDNVW